jgi:hypothetical protein
MGRAELQVLVGLQEVQGQVERQAQAAHQVRVVVVEHQVLAVLQVHQG